MNKLIVNKKDLIHNINKVKEQIKDENYTIIGVVKGNGYGLGLEEYSKILIENGINMLAVATNFEAVKLRELNQNVDILNMSSTAIKEEIEELVDNNIIITIGSKISAEIANEIAKKRKNNKSTYKNRYRFWKIWIFISK